LTGNRPYRQHFIHATVMGHFVRDDNELKIQK